MTVWIPLLGVALVAACAQEEDVKGSEGGESSFVNGGSGGGGGGDGADDCANYRTQYPSGPYGTTEGEVIDDLPGMVDASGTAMSLLDIFGDRTKQVLVIANSFDT